jgi:hypothetical protein
MFPIVELAFAMRHLHVVEERRLLNGLQIRQPSAVLRNLK